MKIQLKMAINFISSKDSDKTRTIHTKSDNTEMMIGSETDEITKELFNSLLQRYQNGLDKLIREVNFLIVLIYCIINFIKQV